MSTQQMIQVHFDLSNGMKRADVAEKYDISVSTVSRYFKKVEEARQIAKDNVAQIVKDIVQTQPMSQEVGDAVKVLARPTPKWTFTGKPTGRTGRPKTIKPVAQMDFSRYNTAMAQAFANAC